MRNTLKSWRTTNVGNELLGCGVDLEAWQIRPSWGTALRRTWSAAASAARIPVNVGAPGTDHAAAQKPALAPARPSAESSQAHVSGAHH